MRKKGEVVQVLRSRIFFLWSRDRERRFAISQLVGEWGMWQVKMDLSLGWSISRVGGGDAAT